MYAAEEVLLVDCENASRLNSTDGRGSSFLLEQGHFAEEVVCAQRSQFEFFSISLGHSLDLAVLDNEHTIARLALADDDLAFFVFFPQTGHFVDPIQLEDVLTDEYRTVFRVLPSVLTAVCSSAPNDDSRIDAGSVLECHVVVIRSRLGSGDRE